MVEGGKVPPIMINIPVKHKGVVIAVATVDNDDADLSKRSWRPNKDGYARWSHTLGNPRRVETIVMHRLIMSRILGRPVLSSERVDHINRDRLDNRRSNLRIASVALNRANSCAANITWNRAARKWQVSCKRDGKTQYGGIFSDKAAAQRAARKLRSVVWPEVS